MRLRREAGADNEGEGFTPKMSRQDLAAFSGVTLYTVSRTLSAWWRDGIVQSGRGRIIVSDPRKLIDVAQAP